MKLIIDIPKEKYEMFLNGGYAGLLDNDLYYDIKNGTPLPKGHGVLKDVTNIMRGLYTDIQTTEVSFTSSEVYKMIDEECPTVIEADKEQEI